MRLLALLAALALVGASGPYSIAGAVYQGGSGPTSSAVPGATVYVHDANNASAAWMGPIVTDTYGRFTFGGLASGSYLLRVFRTKVQVWQQVVPVPPGRPDPIVVPSAALPR